MVSIHIVPVIVCLIIKVISSTFRFKRESHTVAHPAIRGSGIAHLSRTSKRAEASRIIC